MGELFVKVADSAAEETEAAPSSGEGTGGLYRLASAVGETQLAAKPAPRIVAQDIPEDPKSAGQERPHPTVSGLVVRIRFKQEVTVVGLPLLRSVAGFLKQALLIGVAAAAVATIICWLMPR